MTGWMGVAALVGFVILAAYKTPASDG